MGYLLFKTPLDYLRKLHIYTNILFIIYSPMYPSFPISNYISLSSSLFLPLPLSLSPFHSFLLLFHSTKLITKYLSISIYEFSQYEQALIKHFTPHPIWKPPHKNTYIHIQNLYIYPSSTNGIHGPKCKMNTI